ncbi:JAB domain-containing protein [Leeuwenhoekiella marinoflava]|uniref:DNA repair protein RadC n=2 Tax=Leeuwenhoekiella marinoflava TaxID=988 RepID=A0A4Q0PNP8_9FLAO|nr:JAB domain-containing protein [Leeuwenhoekiella marinoflava]RXG32054.1 DNA repair protein RadC [Leeuwenhoekiella marinoflava]SHE96299.1 DNA repair protein radc [Leeuwenhoekiella marinoflava DSM 3653]
MTLESLYNIAKIKVSYIPNALKAERHKVTGSHAAFEVLKVAFNEEMHLFESFKVLLLNNSNDVLGIYTASNGGMTGTLVDVRLILSRALVANATAMILAHNHPSGTLKPSQADKDITAKIKKAAEYLDIKVLDHLIVTAEGFHSFADNGQI